MPPPSIPEFQEHLRRLKRDLLHVFNEGIKTPIPGNDLNFEDLVDMDFFNKLGDYIDHYHAPYLPPVPDFQPDPTIPMVRGRTPTLEGLLKYLEEHWVKHLLQEDIEGLGVHLVYDENAPEGAVSFTLGIHVTDEGMERIPARGDHDAMMHRLYQELEGRSNQ